MTLTRSRIILTFVIGMLAPCVLADEVAPASALAKMPIKEVTVFKDGHAFVSHEGSMATDAAGDVLMDYLPTPVLGAFWPYAADKNAKLSAVVAGTRIVSMEQTALSLRELLEANVGAEVSIREQPTGAKDDTGVKYDATISDIPLRSSEELDKTSPPGTPPKLPVKGNIVLLKTGDGIKAVEIERIRELTFKGKPKTVGANQEFRNLLRLKLDWAGKKPEKEANVGMMYLQKGMRWIPSYKVDLDGKGAATVKLQATLINELADLEDATVNLVIGVPTFDFAGNVDPMALQQTMVQLSQYFQPGNASGQMGNLSNAMMSQVANRPSVRSGEEGTPPPDLGPEIAGGAKFEDLFVFTVQHVTLKKGQRMVIAVGESSLKYRDVYKLDVPFAPPQEVWRNMGGERQDELARLMAAPKVQHKIRMTNSTKTPLTTAPALILLNGKLLAQGQMFYTPAGGEAELGITTAIDISVKKSEKEIKRVHDAATFEGNSFFRVDLEGVLKLTNRKDTAVEVEVTRYIVGNMEEGTASNDGKVEMVNVLEDDKAMPDTNRPYWWGWYSWPSWWGHFNGVGRITWKITLEPGKDVELKYKWNYFWR